MAEDQVAEVAVAETPSGEASEDWRGMISEDLRGDASLAHIGSIDAMAKSYINAQKMVGADKVAIPGSWATEEDWAGVYNKLGRPNESAGYELELADENDAEFTGWYREAAHKAGLSQNQAAELAKAYETYATEAGKPGDMSEADYQAYEVQVKSTLREELGNDWEDRLGLANDLMSELDAPSLSEMTLNDGTKLGDNPEMIKFFVNVAEYVTEATGEDTFAGRSSRPGVTATELQNKISELSKAGSPYWERHHPDHQRTVDEVLSLREQVVEGSSNA